MTSYNYRKDTTDNGIGVIARPNEHFESLFRRFKRSVSKSGIIKEANQKRYYEKKCDKRKRKKAESIKRIQKERRKNG